MVQKIKWNKKNALLVGFEDTTYNGEKILREKIDKLKDIEYLIYPMNPMFIPSDFRDKIKYSKEIYIVKLSN